MKTAIALNLAFQAIKKIAFEFHNLAAAQTGHVDVIALRAALVKVFLTLHVHEIELVDKSLPFEEIQRPIDGNAIDLRIELAGATENLAGIEVLLGGFDDAEDGAALARHAQASRHELSLQSTGNFSLR